MSALELALERGRLLEKELAWYKHELSLHVNCDNCGDHGKTWDKEVCHCEAGRKFLYDDPDSFESDPTTFYSRRSNSEP